MIAANYRITPDEVQEYEEQGFVVLRQPISARVVDELTKTMWSILEKVHRNERPSYVNASPGRADIYNTCKYSSPFRDFVSDRSVAQLAASVARSSTIRFYFDTTFYKYSLGGGDPRQAATALHQDGPAFGFRGRQMPALWLALSDVTMSDGPLEMAPGSHKLGVSYRVPGNSGVPLVFGDRDYSELQDLAKNGLKLVSVPVQRGDVVVIHPYVVHGSIPMTSPRGFRLGFCTRWLGDDARWLPTPYVESEAKSYPRRLEAGELPPDEWFPPVRLR